MPGLSGYKSSEGESDRKPPPGLGCGDVCTVLYSLQPAVYRDCTETVHNTDISVGGRVLTGVHHSGPSAEDPISPVKISSTSKL